MTELRESSAAKIPPGVWLGMAGVIVLDTVVQLTWKFVVREGQDSPGFVETFAAAAAQPAFYLLLILFAAQFLNWILVLAHADLSYVQPITALSYVSVAGCSALVFEEHIGLLRIAGIALIIIGAWLISRTGHRTNAPPADPVAGPSS